MGKHKRKPGPKKKAGRKPSDHGKGNHSDNDPERGRLMIQARELGIPVGGMSTEEIREAIEEFMEEN